MEAKQPAEGDKETDPDRTAEDTETFLGYHQGKEEQPESKTEEIQDPKETKGPTDYKNIVEEDKASGPLFAPIKKSDLPMTAKVDSLLAQQLKQISLEENHFLLPAPQPDDKSGVKIEVYLYGTKDMKQIHISSKAKVLDVVKHLITITKWENKDPNAYELRLIDDDEGYYVPFYDISALVFSDAIGEFASLAFVHNKKYQPPKVAGNLSDLAKTKSEFHTFFVVYIKLSFLETRIEMEMNTKICTLRDLLRKINKRFDVDLRDSHYCFKIHDDDPTPEKDVEGMVYNFSLIDIKTKLKNLPHKELDLVPKTFVDSLVGTGDYSKEEIISCSIKMGTMPALNRGSTFKAHQDMGSDSITDESSESFGIDAFRPLAKTVDKSRETKDFLFNEITSKKLQEFNIIKINSKGKRQNRTLGIDGYNIYNDKVSNRKRKKRYTIFKKIFKPNDAKRSTRPLDTVQLIERLSSKTFRITYKETKKDKIITYECPTTDICSEIMAKLKYLGKNVKDIEQPQ